jgi:hypothetical protein
MYTGWRPPRIQEQAAWILLGLLKRESAGLAFKPGPMGEIDTGSLGFLRRSCSIRADFEGVAVSRIGSLHQLLGNSRHLNLALMSGRGY